MGILRDPAAPNFRFCCVSTVQKSFHNKCIIIDPVMGHKCFSLYARRLCWMSEWVPLFLVVGSVFMYRMSNFGILDVFESISQKWVPPLKYFYKFYYQVCSFEDVSLFQDVGADLRNISTYNVMSMAHALLSGGVVNCTAAHQACPSHW